MYLGGAGVEGLSSTLQSIPDGKEGTAETLKAMRRLVKDNKKSLEIRDLAVKIIGGIGNKKDWFGQAKNVQEFVRDKIRYIRDINGIETLQTPQATLRLGYGDCDDKSILVAALLESIGHPTRFVAIGFSPDNFVHVYPQTRIGTKWVTLETTENVSIGWEPSGVKSRLIIDN